MRRSGATSIDDNAADEKSDKSKWQLLNIHCTSYAKAFSTGAIGFSGNWSLRFRWLYLAFFEFEAIDRFDFDDSIRLFLNLRQLIASISMTLFGFFWIWGNWSLRFRWLYSAFFEFEAIDRFDFDDSVRLFLILRQLTRKRWIIHRLAEIVRLCDNAGIGWNYLCIFDAKYKFRTILLPLIWVLVLTPTLNSFWRIRSDFAYTYFPWQRKIPLL